MPRLQYIRDHLAAKNPHGLEVFDLLPIPENSTDLLSVDENGELVWTPAPEPTPAYVPPDPTSGIVQSAEQTFTSLTAMVAITDLIKSLEAGHNYLIEWGIVYSTEHINIPAMGFTFSGTLSAVNSQFMVIDDSIPPALVAGNSSSAAPVLVLVTGGGLTRLAQGQAILSVSATGNLQLVFRSGSASRTATVLAGSYLRWTQLN